MIGDGSALAEPRPTADGGDAEASRRKGIACLAAGPWNPYLRLLYGHLAEYGFEVVDDPSLTLRWLWRARSSVRFLHLHWPEGLYRYERGPTQLRPLLSRVKLALFATRLAAARILRYRLVWTVHQVSPHESVDPALERRATRLLARSCDLLIAHDSWTADHARAELGGRSKTIAVVPHGSYIGVYPKGRSRREVRSELGLPQDSFVFLCFGELRPYKEIDLLLAAFAAMPLANARLLVAGNAKTQSIGLAVRVASATDPRILSLLGFVPENQIFELFHACDVAVLARGDGGTSGSLILALSMGLPVVAADLPTARELTQDGQAGWLFRPHDVSSLRTALDRAGADPSEARTRGLRAFEAAEKLQWTTIARELADLLDRIDR